MSRKGKPNLKGKQKYPRKCDHCDYISNNPSMHHYHKKTHNPIPEGTLCWQGCGQAATILNTHGKYTCLPKIQHCPAYIKQHSNRVAKQWKNATERKEQTKKSLIKRLHNQETFDKIKETKRKRFGLLTPEQAKEYRHYARTIRQRAQRWAKEQGYILGQQTYHVDHKLSILDAWHAGLSADIVNHPANLRILEAKQNSSKGAKSILTVEELLNLIKLPGEPV
jgi:hypothetical protein